MRSLSDSSNTAGDNRDFDRFRYSLGESEIPANEIGLKKLLCVEHTSEAATIQERII